MKAHLAVPTISLRKLQLQVWTRFSSFVLQRSSHRRTRSGTLRSTGKYDGVIKYGTYMDDLAWTFMALTPGSSFHPSRPYLLTNFFEISNPALPPLEFRHDPYRMPLAVEPARRATISAHPYHVDATLNHYVNDVACIDPETLDCIARWHPRIPHLYERLVG